MKNIIITALLFAAACAGQGNGNESGNASVDSAGTPAPAMDPAMASNVARRDTVIKVLVLPAYDEIANVGGSPDTQRIIETMLAGDDTLKVIPFREQKLMGVPYHMIYDKKYCKPVLDKVPADIVVMSRIITKNEREPGIWPWHYEVKVYNVRTDRQVVSIGGRDLEAEQFSKDINRKKARLISDIFTTFIK